MMLESKARSTKGFSLDQKSSCSISLISSCLPRGVHVNLMNFSESRNGLLRGEGREELFNDIVLIQVGPDDPEGNATKFGQSDLSKTVIGTSITLKECKTNLVC